VRCRERRDQAGRVDGRRGGTEDERHLGRGACVEGDVGLVGGELPAGAVEGGEADVAAPAVAQRDDEAERARGAAVDGDGGGAEVALERSLGGRDPHRAGEARDGERRLAAVAEDEQRLAVAAPGAAGGERERDGDGNECGERGEVGEPERRAAHQRPSNGRSVPSVVVADGAPGG
jgi:hypothetical protein